MDPASPESRAVPTTISASALRPLRHRLGLRSRVTTAFALGALALSSALAGTTYFVVRASIVNQQLSALQHQALANAVLLRGELRVPTAYIPALITTLDSGPNTGSLIYSMNSWYPSSLTLSPRQLPSALRARVLAGLPARQVVRLAGSEQLVVGVPIPPGNSSRTGNAAYFEIFDLSGLVQTLHILLVALTIAALITTIAGAIVGRWAAGRTLRPLHETTRAALAIAGGRLGTRLESADFADLAPLASAFNQMVDQLQERIEREARFTSDVNHELRSPLTTLANSLSVLEARRDGAPGT
jgi:methyl-accepting chemotaxis protein